MRERIDYLLKAMASILASKAPEQFRRPPRHTRQWKPGLTRINLAKKSLPAGTSSTLRKVMRAAGAA